jgi:hypothetical protein
MIRLNHSSNRGKQYSVPIIIIIIIIITTAIAVDCSLSKTENHTGHLDIGYNNN